VEGFEKEVEVDVFQEQFRRLHSGQVIDVYPLFLSGRTNWVAAAKVEESKPIMNVFGFRFSWHLPGGIILVAAAFARWRTPNLCCSSTTASALVPIEPVEPRMAIRVIRFDGVDRTGWSRAKLPNEEIENRRRKCTRARE
jgi:hypothetical protein